MKNLTKEQRYWLSRKDNQMWELMEEAEVVASQMAKYYASSSNYIQEKISGIYNRFKTEHHLTDKEAKQLLNSVKNKDDINALINKIKAMPKSDEKDKFIAELESPAYASRIRRLQEAQDLIDENVSLIYKQDIKRTEKLLKNVAKESYYETMYDIQARTGVAFSFTALDPKKVDKLLKMKWEGRNFSDSIWNNTNALAESLKDELMINFLTGRTESEAAKKIQEKYLSSYSQARRLVRTESAYVANQMDADAYEEAGITHYMIVATLDLRTSDVCREMDGKIYLLKDKQVGSNYPPFHPWCRTTTVESENPEELKNMKRRARDPETGKNYIVPAGTTYQEWYKGLEDKYGKQQLTVYEHYAKNTFVENKLGEHYEKERKIKFGNKATRIDRKYIESQEYRMRFRGITDDPKVDDIVCKYSRQILDHRNNTEFEDLVLLDYDTGRFISVLNTNDIENAVGTYTEEFQIRIDEAHKRGKRILAIHNHPNGLPPSADDCSSAFNQNYFKGVVIGHNGCIYEYEKTNTRLKESQCNAIQNAIALQCQSLRSIDEIYEIWEDIFERNGLIIKRKN